MTNHYDPLTRQIHLRPDATLYSMFHEEAHKDQHETKHRVFMAWLRYRGLRGIGYFLLLWLEIDAYRRARIRLEALGCWDDAARREARKSLLTYFTMREIT